MSSGTGHPAAPADVRIVTTGGTFDKVYDPVSERLHLAGPSRVPGILRACGAALDVESLMSIDSLEMKDDTRDAILAHVRSLERVVVVHGTGTIVDTARLFVEAGLPGTIVFTGAMTPFSCDPIEASFNLGGAIALAASLDPGVYIYMHGEIFDPLRTRKDTSIARLVHEAAA